MIKLINYLIKIIDDKSTLADFGAARWQVIFDEIFIIGCTESCQMLTQIYVTMWRHYGTTRYNVYRVRFYKQATWFNMDEKYTKKNQPGQYYLKVLPKHINISQCIASYDQLLSPNVRYMSNAPSQGWL